jgi:hypothetical protein
MHGSRRSDQIGLPTVAEIEMPLTRRGAGSFDVRHQYPLKLASLLRIWPERGAEFSVEGPMIDDRPWQSAARKAREQEERRVVSVQPGRIVTRSPLSFATSASWPGSRQEASSDPSARSEPPPVVEVEDGSPRHAAGKGHRA